MEAHREGPKDALRPTRRTAVFRKILTPALLGVGVAATLTVPKRSDGATRRVRLVPVKVDGSWYLVGFGGDTGWARDLRASPKAEWRHKRRTVSINAVEVDDDERDRVFVAYSTRLGPLKSDFNRRPEAADHPCFRLEPTT